MSERPYWDEKNPVWRIFKMPDGSSYIEGPRTNQKGVRVIPVSDDWEPDCTCGWSMYLAEYDPNCLAHLDRYWFEGQ